MGIEDRYYDESLIEDFKPITEIDDFKIIFSNSTEFNFSFINKKTNKKEHYCFTEPTSLERIFFKKENNDWVKQKTSWEFNKYIIPSIINALIDDKKFFERSIKNRKIEQKKRDVYSLGGNYATRASAVNDRGVSICKHKLKHIKNLIEYLDPNLQIRASLSIEEEEENGKQ